MNGAIRQVRLFPTVAISIALLVLSLSVISGSAASGEGAQALLRNAERLKLTQPQQTQIRAIIRSTAQEFNRIGRAEQGRPGLRAKQAGLRKQAQEKALALLTDEQRELWTRGDKPTSANSGKPPTDAEKIAARSLIITPMQGLEKTA